MCMRKRMQPRVLTRESSLCQQRQVHLALAGCALTTIYRPPSSTWASRAARQTQQVLTQSHAVGHLPLYIAGCSAEVAVRCHVKLLCTLYMALVPQKVTMYMLFLCQLGMVVAGKPVENVQPMCQRGSPRLASCCLVALKCVGLQGGIGTWWWSLFT